MHDPHVFQKFEANEVSEEMLAEATVLFNDHYGVWGKEAGKTSKYAKPGSRVRLSTERMRKQNLPAGTSCTYVRVTIGNRLAGNAFACRWTVDGQNICWVTQLVVHTDFRQRGVAFTLLNHIRDPADHVYGIMSSHPAACLAASKALSHGVIDSQDLEFIRDHAKSIMIASPTEYVRGAQPGGQLFNPEEANGSISTVFTSFYIDHDEPLRALEMIKEDTNWQLGDLLEGFEFLLILKVKKRRVSGSHSPPAPA